MKKFIIDLKLNNSKPFFKFQDVYKSTSMKDSTANAKLIM